MRQSPYRRFFRTLANDRRLTILHFLAENGTRCVSEIVAGTTFRQSTVSANLQQLLACRFVRLDRQGKEHCYSLNRETIRPLLRLLDRHVARYCAGCPEPVKP